MTIQYKNLDLEVTLESFNSHYNGDKREASVIYFEGNNITEVFKKLELIKDINLKLNE